MVPPGCPASPVAFLQKTHKVTRRFLDSAVRAQLQVQGRCGGYHRVLYMVTSEHLLSNPNSSRAQKVEADLAALQEALGEGGVIAIGPQDFSSTFGFEWGKFPLPGNFTWNHCDAPELVWYDLFRNDLGPDVRHVWVAEYDVGWTGDVASVFASFPERPDFVCSTDWKQDGIAIGPEWSNFPLRTWLKGDEVKQCFIMLARYSLRYMQAFLQETRMGHLQFCEMSGAAICSKHGTWCSIRTFDQYSEVVGRDSRGTSMFRFDRHISRGEWEKLAAADAAERAKSHGAPAALPPSGGTAEATAVDGQRDGGAHGKAQPAGPAVTGRIYHALKW